MVELRQGGSGDYGEEAAGSEGVWWRWDWVGVVSMVRIRVVVMEYGGGETGWEW
jgi:hypothetical protein